jgi:hypothetical protein
MKQSVRDQVRRHRGKLGLIVGAMALAGGLGLIVAYWDWLADGQAGSTAVRNVGLVVGGAIALGIAMWRGVVADRQAKATQQQAQAALQQAAVAQRQAETAQLQAETAQRQAETAQVDLLHRRYQEGTEMLSRGGLPNHLTGIDTLRRLAEGHPREYHTQVMSFLCAFVRHSAGRGRGVRFAGDEDDPKPSVRQQVGEPPEDVKAAMDSISACHARQLRLEERAEFRLDLQGADLSGVLLREAKLSRALLGGAKLVNARLDRIELRRADLAQADLTDAQLLNANLTGATLVESKLIEADLTGANLTGALLAGADLTSAVLYEAKLDSAALLSANLTDARFSARGLFVTRGPDDATGLTQAQLNEARADPNKPPWLDGMVDPETGDPLEPPPRAPDD